MTIRQEDLYVKTWHLAPAVLDEVFRAGDETLPPTEWLHWMLRVHHALRAVEERLWASRSYRPDYSWFDLDPLERVLFSLICRLSYYETKGTGPGQFHGVEFSVRMAAAYLKLFHRRGVDQAAEILTSLIDRGYLVVLEQSRGPRGRVFMPNPLLEENPTLPMRTVPSATESSLTPAPQTVRNGQDSRDTVVDSETMPPPPAQEGQGGASAARTRAPATVLTFLHNLAKQVGIAPKTQHEATREGEAASKAFETRCATAAANPEALAAQRRLEEARQARGLL